MRGNTDHQEVVVATRATATAEGSGSLPKMPFGAISPRITLVRTRQCVRFDGLDTRQKVRVTKWPQAGQTRCRRNLAWAE